MVAAGAGCKGTAGPSDGGAGNQTTSVAAKERQRVDATDAAKTAAANANAFGFRLFNEVVKGHESENVAISGASAAVALALFLEGCAGDSRRVLAGALGYPGDLDANSAAGYGELSAVLNGNGAATVRMANALFTTLEVSGVVMNFEKAFLSTAADQFNAEVKSRDFAKPATLAEVNDWCNRQTEGMIPEILDEIDPLTFAIILNALYFRGTWQKGFNPALTSQKLFRPEQGEPFPVTMMSGRVDARVWDDGQVGVVRIPYRGGDFSMVLMMPVPPDGKLADIRAKLSPEQWASWWKKVEGETYELEVTLPRFRLTTLHELTEPLVDMGLGDALLLGRADYSLMSRRAGRGLVYAEVKQRVVVEVDEQGTKAAAVTVVGPTFFGEPPFVPRFNRPFLFGIVDHRTRAMLFLGQVMDPRKE
jgi:serpin B